MNSTTGRGANSTRNGIYSPSAPRHGRIRECHGDLHLGKRRAAGRCADAFRRNRIQPELRCIDVISDIAFTFMDLADHGLEGLAWRCLSRYLEISGDYDSIALLRLYAV